MFYFLFCFLPFHLSDHPAQATLFLPVSNCRCLQLSFHHPPYLLHTCCLRAISMRMSPPKHSFILSTGSYRVLSTCLLRVCSRNNTHQVLALKLNVCLPPSTLFLELQTHVANCIYDILLDIQKEIHPLSHQTSPSCCFMDLSRWFFLPPGSPNQRIGNHPRLCPLPASPTPERVPVL